TVDSQTRCTHYHSQLDIIAIKFKCCKKYYPCYECHQEAEIHKPQVWSVVEHDQKAILCGVCKHELTITEYINSGNKCTSCKSNFNPGCSLHYHLYFEKAQLKVLLPFLMTREITIESVLPFPSTWFITNDVALTYPSIWFMNLNL